MNEISRRESTGISYVALTAVAVAATWIIHEFAHWSVGELLGNNMIMTLNSSFPANSQYEKPWHATIISAAGPFVTILQAFACYFFLKKTDNKLLFPSLLTCLYMRALAGVMNLINLNDEGRISRALGLGAFTVPFLVFGILLYLVFAAIREKEYKTKLVVVTVFLIMLFSSILIMCDQLLQLTLIHG